MAYFYNLAGSGEKLVLVVEEDVAAGIVGGVDGASLSKVKHAVSSDLPDMFEIFCGKLSCRHSIARSPPPPHARHSPLRCDPSPLPHDPKST